MKKFLIVVGLILVRKVDAQENLLPYVNPFIGTEKMGHTYPGATAPFGAVQLSPDGELVFYMGAKPTRK